MNTIAHVFHYDTLAMLSKFECFCEKILIAFGVLRASKYQIYSVYLTRQVEKKISGAKKEKGIQIYIVLFKSTLACLILFGKVKQTFFHYFLQQEDVNLTLSLTVTLEHFLALEL